MVNAKCVTLVLLGCSVFFLQGCMSVAESRAMSAPLPGMAAMDAASSGSLFPGDQIVVTDKEIEKIFATKITTAEGSKVSIVRYGGWLTNYWSEELARLDQDSTDQFVAKMRGVKKLRTVQVVPEMLLPRQMDIPHLREMAARVQADLLVIYRPSSHSYQKSQFLKKDATRAYCTVEIAVLDTRTGVVVFTTRASENFSAEESNKDMNFDETIGRAQQQAAGRAMVKIADELAAFFSAS